MPGRNLVRSIELNCTKPTSKNKTARETIMTAQQYLLSQAEHCRRTAAETADPFVADELKRLAAEFEHRAERLREPAHDFEAA
jgi:hypothetical protein